MTDCHSVTNELTGRSLGKIVQKSVIMGLLVLLSSFHFISEHPVFHSAIIMFLFGAFHSKSVKKKKQFHLSYLILNIVNTHVR